MESLKIGIAVIFLSNMMNVVITFELPRPPPFPDIYESFEKTLHYSSFREYTDKLCELWTEPDVCNGTACLVENWTVYNTVEKYPELTCDVTTIIIEPTTVAVTTTTTTTTKATTTTTIKTPTRTVNKIPARTTDKSVTSTVSKTTSTTTEKPVPSTSSETRSTIQQTTSTTQPSNVTQGINVPVPAVYPPAGINISSKAIIAIACGCLLALLATAAILFALRNLVSPRSKRPKRKRSDRVHLNSNQESAPTTPTPEGRTDLNNGYSNSAFHWQDGESTDSSGIDYSQYILNPTEQKHDYSTLKVLEHPHALNMGGFGESTDTMTLKKKSTKKKRGSKKMDTNHNRKGSHGTNSIGGQSIKGSIKSKGSINSKTSVKSKSSDNTKNGMLERHVSLPESTAVLFSQLKATDESDDLVDSNNVHLFAYDNPVTASSMTSISSLHDSTTILPPPPEFRNDKVKGSPFNTSDSGHVEDPPTAIVRPSVKQPPTKVVLNQPEVNSVHIPMQELAASCTSTFQREGCNGNPDLSTNVDDAAVAASSFLWNLNEKAFVS